MTILANSLRKTATRGEFAASLKRSQLVVLAASIAHEVNQPLSGIITNSNTCLRMLASDPPDIVGAIETARRTIRDGNRAAEVVTHLRALFTDNDLNTESVDLNEAAREVISICWDELEKNRVILQLEFSDSLPLVGGVRFQLQQVILNLLRNGSDAMRGIEDRPRILLIRTAPDEGGGARLTVVDSGIGFDVPDTEMLFEAFYTTKGDGMGIGLSVCRSIVERFGGRLWAIRNDGHGSSFSFSIPCHSNHVTCAPLSKAFSKINLQ